MSLSQHIQTTDNLTPAPSQSNPNTKSNNINNITFFNDLKTQYKVTAPIIDEDYLENPKVIKEKVQPFTKDDIQKIKIHFLAKCQSQRYYNMNELMLRDYTWFIFGLNTARRASDFTQVRICDLIDEQGNIRDFWQIEHEQKTQKKAIVPINTAIKKTLVQYLPFRFPNGYKMSDYLFVDYKSHQPLTTENVRIILKRTCEKLGIQYNVGSHSLRKTFAAMATVNNPDDAYVENTICQILNHESVKTSHIYMGQNLTEQQMFMENNAL